MIKTYYELAKPGIVYGNAITAIGGFFLAERGHFNLVLFTAMLLGLSLVIASACVANNYLDRDIDAKMQRTKNRALVTHALSERNTLAYAAILVLLGVFLLVHYTNYLTLGLALFGFVLYVGVYTPLKRRTVHGTLIGSIPGAIPPVVGYCAVTNHFDLGAGILFLILLLWQMPHFYAIAMYRLHDYTEASIPVLPVVCGMKATRYHIISYIIALVFALGALSISGYAGYTFLVVMTGITLIWLAKGLQQPGPSGEASWGRGMFFFSLIVILVLCTILSLNSYLH